MLNLESLEAVYIYIVEFNKKINKHRKKLCILGEFKNLKYVAFLWLKR